MVRQQHRGQLASMGSAERAGKQPPSQEIRSTASNGQGVCVEDDMLVNAVQHTCWRATWLS
jgi:hypothetical protein